MLPQADEQNYPLLFKTLRTEFHGQDDADISAMMHENVKSIIWIVESLPKINDTHVIYDLCWFLINLTCTQFDPQGIYAYHLEKTSKLFNILISCFSEVFKKFIPLLHLETNPASSDEELNHIIHVSGTLENILWVFANSLSSLPEEQVSGMLEKGCYLPVFVSAIDVAIDLYDLNSSLFTFLVENLYFLARSQKKHYAKFHGCIGQMEKLLTRQLDNHTTVKVVLNLLQALVDMSDKAITMVMSRGTQIPRKLIQILADRRVSPDHKKSARVILGQIASCELEDYSPYLVKQGILDALLDYIRSTMSPKAIPEDYFNKSG